MSAGFRVRSSELGVTALPWRDSTHSSRRGEWLVRRVARKKFRLYHERKYLGFFRTRKEAKWIADHFMSEHGGAS